MWKEHDLVSLLLHFLLSKDSTWTCYNFYGVEPVQNVMWMMYSLRKACLLFFLASLHLIKNSFALKILSYILHVWHQGKEKGTIRACCLLPLLKPFDISSRWLRVCRYGVIWMSLAQNRIHAYSNEYMYRNECNNL